MVHPDESSWLVDKLNALRPWAAAPMWNDADTASVGR
jgi:hypothetical protein